MSCFEQDNILEHDTRSILPIEVAILPNMKKKNINTRKEQEKKAQREKEAAKKALTSQLPAKGKKK